MKLLSKLKRAARIGLVFGVFSAAMAGASLIANHSTSAVAANTCDKVNVIYCGLDSSNINVQIAYLEYNYIYNTSEHPTPYHDIQTIYNYVGASSSLITTMNTSNTVAATIYRNGNVTVNGKVIATNAMSVGRFYVPGATLIPGTNAYIRYTTSSFANDSLPAIVRLDSNGNMLFGAMVTCGNAFKATPVKPAFVPKPSYTITKQVAVKGSSAYAQSVNVNPGTHVVYRIAVASDGNTAVTNLNVKDALPANIQYVDGTLQNDNVSIGKEFFSTGYNIAKLNFGIVTVFTFEGIVGPNDTVAVCSNEVLDNVGSMTATGLPSEYSIASVNKSCYPKPPTYTPPAYVPPVSQPTPAYACLSLSAYQVSRTVFNYTATATATNGAAIKAYNFNFGDSATQTIATNATVITLPHDYAYTGTYGANVSVTVSLPGGLPDATVTSAACATTVTVTPPPIAECTDLKLLQATGNPRYVTATVTYRASNGASLNNVSFNWNDGTVTNNGVVTSAQHTYAVDGNFNVVATLSFSVGANNLPASTCQATVSINTVPPTVPPVTLVNTGPGSIASLFAGFAAIGAVGYRFFLGRRLVR